MSTSQPSCLRWGLDWCLNKMLQCFLCPSPVHRIPTISLFPLFWQTGDTKVMQSLGSKGETAIPPSFIWPWLRSVDLGFIPLTLTQLCPLFYQSLRCLHDWLVLLPTRGVLEEIFSFRHALCLHFISKLTYSLITPGERSDQSDVNVFMPTTSALGRGGREDWRCPPQASPHTAPRLRCFSNFYFFFLEETRSNDLIASPLLTIPVSTCLQTHVLKKTIDGCCAWIDFRVVTGMCFICVYVHMFDSFFESTPQY